MELTMEQQSVIIGSLLGDGAMRCKRNALLEINHGIAQKAYVDWKFSILTNLVATPPKERRSNGCRVAYRFTTLSLPVLTPFYQLFYDRERHKIVPPIMLSPLALAVWFMDDGRKSHRTIYLNTQQFDLERQQMLLAMLLDQWEIRGALNRDKNYQRIRIAVSSAKAFIQIIEKHVLPELRYKIPTRA